MLFRSATIGGLTATATAVQASSSDAVRRTAILAIDTSNSMRGPRFDAARSAAETFLDTVPDDVYVGIVTFNSEVTTAQTPTLDHDAARKVLDGLTLSRATRLYDGVLSAIQVAGTQGQRQLVVLSDGADTTTTSLTSVLRAVRRSDTLVDVISLDSSGRQPDLVQLAEAGRGEVVPASSDALRAAFADEADALSRQVLVSSSCRRASPRPTPPSTSPCRPPTARSAPTPSPRSRTPWRPPRASACRRCARAGPP